MRAQLLDPASLTPADVHAWKELAARAVDPNPMNEPACVLAAARHLPHGGGIRLLVARDDAGFHGAVPIRRIDRGGTVHLRVASTDIRRMTYLGTPLLDDRGAEAMCHMLGALDRARHAHRWSLFVARWVAQGPAEAMIREAATRRRSPVAVVEDFEQPFLRRREDPTSYLAGQSKRHLNDYRRRARRMEELLGAPVELVDRGCDGTAIDEFATLEAAGYKLGNGVAMVTRPGEVEFFREMCHELSLEKRLHVLCLQSGTRTVAMQISLRAGDGLFLIKVGHDEALARYDPGVQLHLRAIEHFHSTMPAQWLDVCTFPDNDLLLRLYPDRRRTVTLAVPVGGPVGSVAVRAWPLARSLRRLGRRISEAADRPTTS